MRGEDFLETRRRVDIWEMLPEPYFGVLSKITNERTFDERRMKEMLLTEFKGSLRKRDLDVRKIIKFIEYLGGKVWKDGKTYEISMENMESLIVRLDFPIIVLISDLHSYYTDFASLEKIISRETTKKYGHPLVVVAGDLTESGKRGELDFVSGYVDFFIWGNHDIGRGSELLEKPLDGCLGRMVGGIEIGDIFLLLVHDYLKYLRRYDLVETQLPYDNVILVLGHGHDGFLRVKGKNMPFYVKKDKNRQIIILPLGALTKSSRKVTEDFVVLNANEDTLDKYIWKPKRKRDKSLYSISF